MKMMTSLFAIDRKKKKTPKGERTGRLVPRGSRSSERRVKAENKWLGLNLNGGSGGGVGVGGGRDKVFADSGRKSNVLQLVD